MSRLSTQLYLEVNVASELVEISVNALQHDCGRSKPRQKFGLETLMDVY